MNAQSMLTPENTALIIIDVQEKLSCVMYEREILFNNIQRLIKGMQVLDIPIIITEQNPKGLGATVPEVANLLPNLQPIPKLSFSCCGDERFLRQLEGLNCKQVLIAGIEAHVCVYQTAIGLLNLGYKVHAVVDAVSSRTVENKKIGLKKMSSAGARLTSIETALFELLKVAEGEKFKAISKLVK